MRSVSTNMAKVVIAINGKANVNSGLLAVQARQDSTDQRTLRVTGTIALKHGWKISVKMFVKDDNWVAKSSSGFGCHLLKTLAGCTTNQQAQTLVKVFDFFISHINNDSDVIADFDVNNSPEDSKTVPEDLSDTSLSISCAFSCLFLLIRLLM